MHKQTALTNLVHGVADDELDHAFSSAPSKARPVRRIIRKRQPESDMRAINRVMSFLSIALLVVILCGALVRVSFIRQNTQRIETLLSEIDELASQQKNLNVRLSMSLNMERIESEAIERLGMEKPRPENVRVIALGGPSQGVSTAQAVTEGKIAE